MIKTCPICGKQFETHDGRQKYCSKDCAWRAKVKQNSAWNKGDRDEKRREWAHDEAEKLVAEVMIQSDMDGLADYIYNNYKKKGSK